MAYSDGMHQIAQVMPGCILPEAHQHGFRHIQRHHVGRGGKTPPDQNPPGKRYHRNGYGSHRRYRRYPAAAYGSARRITRRPTQETPPRFIMKSGSVVRGDVNRFLDSCGVTERLHDQIGGESQIAPQSSSSHRGVIGPVVSREPTESVRSTRPTGYLRHHIFCASEKPCGRFSASRPFGSGRKTFRSARQPQSASRALVVRPRPIISGIRPPHALRRSVGFQFEGCQQFVSFVIKSTSPLYG